METDDVMRMFGIIIGCSFLVGILLDTIFSKKTDRKDFIIRQLSHEVSDALSEPEFLWNHRDIKKALLVHKKVRRILGTTSIVSTDITSFDELEIILQEKGVLRTVEEIKADIKTWDVKLRTKINYRDIERNYRVKGIFSHSRKSPAVEDAVNAAINHFIGEITASGGKIESRITADVFSTDKITGFGMERYV